MSCSVKGSPSPTRRVLVLVLATKLTATGIVYKALPPSTHWVVVLFIVDRISKIAARRQLIGRKHSHSLSPRSTCHRAHVTGLPASRSMT